MPRSLVLLGTVLDLLVRHEGKEKQLSWKGTPRLLCTDAHKRALWILPASRRRQTAAQVSSSEADVFRSWHDFAPEGVDKIKVRIGPATELRGSVIAIGYRSDKWSRKPTDYEHRFDDPPELQRSGNVHRISGGKLRVTSRGVVG